MIKKDFERSMKVNVDGKKNADYFFSNSTPLYSELQVSKERKPRSDSSLSTLPDIICLSHLRWDFVWQRPQHLLSRCAGDRRVFYVEEPIFGDYVPYLNISSRDCGVNVVVPHLPEGLDEIEIAAMQQSLLIDELLMEYDITDYVLWYYTPMSLSFTRHLEPLIRVYDCMDELSAFKFAPPGLKRLEAELLESAELVFTGGYSLYEAKRHLHSNIHPFPSSIEAVHFRQARFITEEPADQRNISHPRLGFFGVIDERMDLELLASIADARPDWHLVMIGPVVKINPVDLPQRDNIHYLGGKNYQELPDYLAGWEIAMMPFARNESTRFISPTKTPEYLAAGVPVISTSIRDVVRQYEPRGLVRIADTTADFIQAAEFLLSDRFNYDVWLRQVDESLAFNSWDRTWMQMSNLINTAISTRYAVQTMATLPLAPDATIARALTPVASR
jgi:glycosyltransferase involved in cell wall biosynthesis